MSIWRNSNQKPSDSKEQADSSSPYIWGYCGYTDPYQGVIFFTVSILSMLWYPFCTGFEEGKATYNPVHAGKKSGKEELGIPVPP
jgi:hypothetical protein